MEFKDLKVGRVYRTKKPEFVGFIEPFVNDRQILYISTNKQPVKSGNKYKYTKEYKKWFEERTDKQPFDSIERESIYIKYEDESGLPCVEYDYIIQYDTPGGLGKHYPKMYAKKFAKWAHEDVTDILPKGEWAKWETLNKTNEINKTQA